MLHKERLEEQRRKMSFLKVVTGNRMTGRKRNTDVAEITDINTITETYQTKRLQNVQRKSWKSWARIWAISSDRREEDSMDD